MKEQKIREELMQCRELMTDVFQSGLTGLPESLKDRCRREATFVRQYGMEWLADRIVELTEQLEKQRHLIGGENAEEVVGLFCKIITYLEEGIRLSGLEEAGIRISQREWEQE